MHRTFGEPKNGHTTCVSRGVPPPNAHASSLKIQVTLQHGHHAVIGGGRLLQRQGGQTGCYGRHTGSVNLSGLRSEPEKGQVTGQVTQRRALYMFETVFVLSTEQFRRLVTQ